MTGSTRTVERASMYFDALTKAMTMLAKQPNTLFVGQAVAFDGQAAFKTFSGVPRERRIELPVAEDFQMGFCAGLALQGYLPICFYPRFDFLLMACNQLINHLDKFPLMGPFAPKVIIRTAVGRKKPLDPGQQHTGNYSHAFRQMLRTVDVFECPTAGLVATAYSEALRSKRSSIVVETMENY